MMKWLDTLDWDCLVKAVLLTTLIVGGFAAYFGVLIWALDNKYGILVCLWLGAPLFSVGVWTFYAACVAKKRERRRV